MTGLTVADQTHDSVTILQLKGRIDASNAQDAEASLFEYLGSGVQLAVDFSELEFISSAGLRIFLMMAKKIKVHQGKLALFALSPVVNEVFEISGFSKILTICPNQEQALQALA
jgi:anti-anti-sigma factor